MPLDTEKFAAKITEAFASAERDVDEFVQRRRAELEALNAKGNRNPQRLMRLAWANWRRITGNQ